MSKPKETAETPLMKQYNAIKAKYPDALLLFRVGDFYETFGEDAIRASNILGIVLTRRANGSGTYMELAGFPHHSLDLYLPKLVKADYGLQSVTSLRTRNLQKRLSNVALRNWLPPEYRIMIKFLSKKKTIF